MVADSQDLSTFSLALEIESHSWANSLPDHICPDNGVQVLTFSSSDL